MLAAQRLQAILENITSQGSAGVPELSRRYGVSEMTIRRDLKLLERQGQIRRIHGGAILASQSALQLEPPYDTKAGKRAAEKALIARYAAEHFLEDGDIIIMEGGTTIHEMIPHLASYNQLTIITNSLYTLTGLKPYANKHSIITSGGVLRDVSFTFVGAAAEATFREFSANKAFLSASGWTPDFGFCDPRMLDTQVKRAMVAAASKTIMLLDSSKFGVTSLTTFLPAFGADILITDAGIPAEVSGQMVEHGVDVHIAQETERSVR